MKTALLPSLVAVLSAAVSLHAAEGQKFNLQHRSSFTPPSPAHNPFWPIGWIPSASTAPVQAAPEAGPFDPATIVVSSVLLGASPQMAIINNHDYALGEVVNVNGNQAQLVGIRDGAVVLRYGGRDFVIELKIH